MVGKMQQSRNCAAFMIVAAGPVVVEEGMQPCRVVLRRQAGGFVTHMQGLTGRRHHLHASFNNGCYYTYPNYGQCGAWQKALESFIERVRDHSLAMPPANIIDG